VKPKDHRIWSFLEQTRSNRPASFVYRSAIFALITIPFVNSASALRPIYGDDRILDDDRRGLSELNDSSGKLKELARSVAAVVSESSLIPDGENYKIVTSTLSLKADLEADSKFEDELAPGYCTAVLLTADTVLTARHCLPSLGTGTSGCGNTRFIFDFDQSKAELQQEQVRACTSISEEDPLHDTAVVILDRPVTDRTPVRYLPTRSPKTGEDVYVVGHPSGLPKKVSGPYPVLEQQGTKAFAQLNTFKGSSGSPVFSSEDYAFVGLLIAGASDYSKTKTGKSQVSLYKRLTPKEWANRKTSAHAEVFLTPAALPSDSFAMK
jgi:V8-like Glu-specific endopeptidase